MALCDLRSHLGSSSDLRYSMVEGQDGHYSTTVIRRAQKGRLSALRDDPNKVAVALCFLQEVKGLALRQSHHISVSEQ